jgi:hypothetical protein
MRDAPNRYELIGYLEEALPMEDMVRVEECLRASESWREVLRELTEEVGTGEHSIATVWRRHRLTCPSRERLGAHRIGGLIPEESEYIRFHLEVIGCRWCMANLRDVEAHTDASKDEDRRPASTRRQRFYQTSVGFLPKAAKPR